MATIQERHLKGGWRYTAVIRRRGFPRQSKTFGDKDSARRWARAQEAAMDSREFQDHKVVDSVTLGEALDWYIKEIVPSLRQPVRERQRAEHLKKYRIAQTAVGFVQTADVSAFVRERERELKRPGEDGSRQSGGNTIRLDLALLRRLYNLLPRDFPGMEALRGKNPIVGSRSPANGSPAKIPAGRDRVLSSDEEKRLFEVLPPALADIVGFALETAMRKSEIMGLTWARVGEKTVRLGSDDTKNSRAREVPLTRRAREILSDRHAARRSGERYVFARVDVSSQFAKYVEKAGLQNLRFHDLRHTAVTRFFDWYKLGIERVALISGHVDWKMLRRYTHLSAEQIADTLAEKSASSEVEKLGTENGKGEDSKNAGSRKGTRCRRAAVD